MIAARQRYPGAPEPWIDLSTGINPVPYPVPPIPLAALARLPEPEQVAALEAAAARAYGVADPAAVVAGPGTQALIHLLPRLLPPGRVAVVGPTYAEHAAAWALAGHDVVEAASVEDAAGDVVVVVRPNNPDGLVHDAAALLGHPAALLVVDEAFADLEGCSLAAAVPRPGLLILRSFGKTYGLAGVRLGFAPYWPGAGGPVARRPRAVGGERAGAACRHACVGGCGGGAPEAAARLRCLALRLDQAMIRAGAELVGGTALFRLYRHPAAASVAGRLARAGVLVRVFAGRPELLRLGLPAEAVWQRVHSALAGPPV